MLSRLRKALFSAVRGRGLSRLPGGRWLADTVHATFRQRFAEAHGCTLELDPGDTLGLSVFGDYEKVETELVRRTLREGDVVLDLGAHIGYYTTLCAKLVGPAGRVYAFEPAPETFRILSDNLARNGISNVEALNAAVGAQSTEGQLFLGSNRLDHHAFDRSGIGHSVPIRVLAVDDVITDPRGVQFVKMDIQGGEPAALHGMTRTLERTRNVRILTEFWPAGITRAGFDPAAFLHDLDSMGFRISELDHRDGSLAERTAAMLLDRSWGAKESTYLLCERS
jgi:FkbM family methyltransferase